MMTSAGVSRCGEITVPAYIARGIDRFACRGGSLQLVNLAASL